MLLWHFESHPFFWTAILISGFYLLCVMHRLAFFNVASADTDGFVGLPSPLGALGVAFVWSLDPDLKELLLAYILMAAWMVSPHSIKRPKLKGKLFILGLIAMTIALHLKNL
jgi:phosphatidylserine synthase